MRGSTVDASPCELVRRAAISQGFALFPFSALRSRRRGNRCLRGCRRLLFLEINLWSLPRTLIGLEVRVVPRKPTYARYQVVREKRNISVVVLQSLIVAAPLHRDSVLCPRQLILQPQKVLVRLQLRIVFNHNQQPSQSRVERLVGRNFVGRSFRIE